MRQNSNFYAAVVALFVLAVAGLPSVSRADCGSPTIEVSASSPLVVEGDSGSTSVDITIGIDVGGVACGWEVVYGTVDETATSGADYSTIPQATSGCLTGDQTDAVPGLTVDILGDTVPEFDETFSLELEYLECPLTDTSVIADEVVTILNDDAPEIFINDVDVDEGGFGITNAVFTVRAEPLTMTAIPVNFQTMDGTATVADGDYEAVSGVVIIEAVPPHEMTISVPVNGDFGVEDDETFTVELTGVDAAGTIADGEGIGTILNDDSPSALKVPTVSGWGLSILVSLLLLTGFWRLRGQDRKAHQARRRRRASTS